MALEFDSLAEWLETDGLGGFASGTVSGRRSRRYHALLLAASAPPSGRMALVNGIEASIEVGRQTFAISAQHYAPDVNYPDGDRRIESFEVEPWPRWVYRLENGVQVEQELFVPHGQPTVALRWRLQDSAGAAGPVRLSVRPLMSGRDYHAMHHENPAFRFDAATISQHVTWHPYQGVPGISAVSNAEYRAAPLWFRNFLYQQEADRGLDCLEDLASPGEFRWNLAEGDAVWIVSAIGLADSPPEVVGDAREVYRGLRVREQRRRAAFRSPVERAADGYLVRRGTGRTIIAGYPWFTDWGRDTFIAMRGLVIAAGRLDVAREILLAWARTVSEGMLPNRFPDHGDTPEFNSVDASLWYIIAVHEYLAAIEAKGASLPAADQQAIAAAVAAILEGYIRGTRYKIRVDDDGLLAAGEPGVQLTWMDAKVGDSVVTPRIGKPVELQALWLNALHIAERRWPNAGPGKALGERGQESFLTRFWNADRSCLYDVVDVDHVAGRVDAALRPNQILAVGGLPLALVSGQRARQIVDAVGSTLLTPLGLRSLAPGEPGYRPHNQGGVWERDGAYHQGTVWPWLIGPFVEAWLRVHAGASGSQQIARERFIAPLIAHLQTAGIGHVSEIADGDPPHTPRGCPFQAWSLGELTRLQHILSADKAGTSNEPSRRAVHAAMAGRRV